MCKAYRVLADTKNMERDEWLRCRRMGIGGSDAAAIVGLNPWSSPSAVYADKMGWTEDKETSEAMRLGNDLEQYVAERFMEAAGKKVRRENHILQSVDHPFMLANVDRMVIGENAGLECKTTSPFSRYDWESGNVPNTYYCQCQHYMATLGCAKWYLAVLVFSKGFFWFEVDRNEDDIAALIEAEKTFWNEHVLNQVPPEPDGSEASGIILKSMYTGDTGGEVQLSGLEADLARYEEIEKLSKSLEAEKKLIAQRVQARMGDAHIGHAPGFMATWKPIAGNRLDSKRLKAERPEIYAEYSKKSVSRRFVIKEKKEAM